MAYQAWGSDGDIRPLIALAVGLKTAGHDTTLAVTSTENRDYTSICQRYGIEYIKAPERIECDLAVLGENIHRLNYGVKAFKYLAQEIYLPYLEDMYAASMRLCDSCDLVVGHFTVFPLKVAAAQTQTPYVSTVLFRGFVPSIHRPPGSFPNFGRFGNYIGWKLTQHVLDLFFKKKLKQFWAKANLKAPRHVVPGAWESDRLNLIAASQVFCPHQPDWGARYQVCGYFYVPEYFEAWQMPNQLREFLDAGEKPVYMTFGLLQPYFQNRIMELMRESSKLAGCRAIIQTNHPDYLPHSSDGNLYFIDKAPHQQIFSECAAVVHHGGGGTAHSVSRCDCPSVVAGFSNEHMAYGYDLYRKGAAASPIRYRKATAENIARKIDEVLHQPSMAVRAAGLGKIMRNEKGVDKAVELIQKLGIPDVC